MSEEELERQRTLFRNGQLDIRIEEQTFSMKCAHTLPRATSKVARQGTPAAHVQHPILWTAWESFLAGGC